MQVQRKAVVLLRNRQAVDDVKEDIGSYELCNLMTLQVAKFC